MSSERERQRQISCVLFAPCWRAIRAKREGKMKWRLQLLPIKLFCSLCPLAAAAFTSHPLPPFTHLDRSARHAPGLPLRPLSRQKSRLSSLVASHEGSSSSDDEEPFGIQPIYLLLATAETIFWYWLAPGIDPASRWLAPVSSSP